MTRSTGIADVLDDLAAARPVDEDGWADSPIGRAVFARSIALADNPSTTDRRSRRPMAASIAAACLLLGGGGIAWAFTTPHGSAPRQHDLAVVMCADAFDLHADLTEAEDPQRTAAGAIAACAGYWRTAAGGVVPANLVSCVYPSTPNNDGGGRAVFPAPAGLSGADACAQLGATYDNS